MAFKDRLVETVWGRRFGLQKLSSVESGSTDDEVKDFLAGPAGIRVDVTNPETTGVPLKAVGLSVLATASSGVHELNPPIPGIFKTLVSTGGSTAYVKTRNGETIESSRGSTFNTLQFVSAGVALLQGMTTGRWLWMSESSGTAPAIVPATST